MRISDWSSDVCSSDLGVPAFELLRRAGLATSNGEARRLIKGGGGRVNDVRIETETTTLSLADVNADGVLKLSAGRKRHALIRPVRSAARRVGEECVSACTYRWSPFHLKKKQKT